MQLEVDKDYFNYLHPATFKIWAYGRLLCVLFMECMSQAIVDELSLSVRLSLRPLSNINQSIGAHGECMSVNLKLCPDFE